MQSNRFLRGTDYTDCHKWMKTSFSSEILNENDNYFYYF